MPYVTLHATALRGRFMEARGSSETVEEVMTIPEVAQLLRVTAKTVYKLVRAGALRSFRVGRVMRCRRHEVDRFMADREQSSRPRVEGAP